MCLITNKEARTPPWHSINTIHIYLHVDDRCLPNKILQNEIQHPVPPWTLHPVAQFLGTGHHWALRLTESTVPGPRHSTSRPTASQSAARAQALDHLRSQILNKITYIRLTYLTYLTFTSFISCFSLVVSGCFLKIKMIKNVLHYAFLVTSHRALNIFEPLDPNG